MMHVLHFMSSQQMKKMKWLCVVRMDIPSKKRENEKKCFVVLGYPSLERLKESKFNKQRGCTRTAQKIFF